MKKSTIVTPAEQNSGERVDVQVSNEQVDDVSDKDDDDLEIGEDLTTNVEEWAPNEKQTFNEPVCGVIDIHRELNRQGDLEQTHIPSAAQLCQKESGNVGAEVGESGHSLGSLESRVEDSFGFEVSGKLVTQVDPCPILKMKQLKILWAQIWAVTLFLRPRI
ncbi:hypothetical protein RHMOL_Rhmol06G0238700 [Rhododendron molle]|uniref:Uncharacterized protein n=1 Tax=Rhododendron molle TaxID=49168 RepID=A0ACC0NHN3_RHOML|nr:hypothetical protein RHMOL_Rhmol06G0238700 [Rhododendron molle]